MLWIAPSAKDSATDTLEKRLWDAADQMRANSGLSPQQYSGRCLLHIQSLTSIFLCMLEENDKAVA